MKRLIFAGFALLMPIVASSTSSPALFPAQARGPWDEPQKIAAGTARLDEALDRLVPASYRIVVDGDIPAQVVLVWPAGADWERAVRAALDPIGIEIQVREAEKVVHLRRAVARAYVGRIKRVDDDTAVAPREQQKPAATAPGSAPPSVAQPPANPVARVAPAPMSVTPAVGRLFGDDAVVEKLRGCIASSGVPVGKISIEARTRYDGLSSGGNREFTLQWRS